MPNWLASDCSEQLPERTQLVQVESCRESKNSKLALRAARTRGLLVRTVIPSRATLLQEATSCSVPSISTRHTRQAPISLRSLR